MEPARAVLPRTFESLKERNFRFFWGAMMGHRGALNMQLVARSWFMYQLTGSPAMLGAVNLVNAVPMLALSLFGGIIADRVQKKHVLVWGEAASALVSLGIALTITLGIITWVHLMVASFIQGVIRALIAPSREAIIPEIVGQERLTNAVALHNAGTNINRLMAPAIAGLLITPIGVDGVYYVMAGLYALAFFLIFLMPHTGTASLAGGGALARLADGLQYVRRNNTVLTILAVTLIGVVLSMPYMTLLPIFAEDVLRVGAKGQGLLMSLSGLGALVGSFIIANLGNKRRGILYLYSLVILGLALTVFSFSHWYALSLAIMIPVGFGQAGRMALSQALVQTYTEDTYRGRVMSIYMMEFGLTNVGAFGIAILAQFIGVQWAIGSMALLLITITLYILAFMPRLRRLN